MYYLIQPETIYLLLNTNRYNYYIYYLIQSETVYLKHIWVKTLF